MLHFWPLALTSVAEAYISVKRIEEFLLLPESKTKSGPNLSGDQEDDTLLNKKPGNMTNGSNMILNKFSSTILDQRRLSRQPSNQNFSNRGIIFDNATALWSGATDENKTGKIF